MAAVAVAVASTTRRLSSVPAMATHCTTSCFSGDPFTAVAHALSSSGGSASGWHLHAHAVKLGVSGDTFTMNHLLTFYSRRGLLDHARRVFDEMPHRNLVSWTAMVSASARNGAPHLALRLLAAMVRSGLRPNEFALAASLSACQCQCQAMAMAPHAKLLGLSLHAIAVRAGLDANPFVGTSLLLLYAGHGRVAAAEQAFADIRFRDLACWNAMLDGYVSMGRGREAMRTVTLMHRSGLAADMFTYIAAAKACFITGELEFGRQLHCLMIHGMLESDTSVMNVLVDMYFRAGMKDTAMAVFGRITHKDIVSWNTVISSFAHDEDEGAALGCFADMSRSGRQPNEVTLSVLLRLSGAMENALLGLQIFGLACRHGYSDDVLVANAVISMTSRCGFLDRAFRLFCSLGFRNIVSWNEMIAGYALHNCSDDAMRLFRCMVCFEPRPDDFTYSALLSAIQQAHNPHYHEQIHAGILKHGFASCQFVSTSLIKAMAAFGSLRSSLKVIQDTGMMDVVSWGVIIAAFLNHGMNHEVLSLFNLFRSDCKNKPDEFIFGSVLNACANAAMIRNCRRIHLLVVRTGHGGHFCVASALVDAYAKCGDIAAARSAFADAAAASPASCGGGGDTVLYNAMLMAYANHGLIDDALGLYGEMARARLAPTPATFVAVVSACSHLGLVEQGRHLFSLMLSGHGLNPTRANYAAMVDLLARRGLLWEARAAIEAMPFPPWPAVWRSLMNGCRIHGDRELGVLAAEQILRMAPASDGAYVSLANAYAGDGEWQAAEETRRRMAGNQVHKVQGYSRVEV